MNPKLTLMMRLDGKNNYGVGIDTFGINVSVLAQCIGCGLRRSRSQEGLPSGAGEARDPADRWGYVMGMSF